MPGGVSTRAAPESGCKWTSGSDARSFGAPYRFDLRELIAIARLPENEMHGLARLRIWKGIRRWLAERHRHCRPVQGRNGLVRKGDVAGRHFLDLAGGLV